MNVASTLRLLSALLLLSGLALAARGADYLDHRLEGATLVLETTGGKIDITPHRRGAFAVHYDSPGVRQLPSFALAHDTPGAQVQLSDDAGSLEFSTGELTARIQKSPVRLSYYEGERLLVEEEIGYFAHETIRGFRFKLHPGERLLGGGERVLGMDRRGHRLPLYNKPDYGYSTESTQMYYSVPAVLSNRKYMLVFDNSARGAMDLGSSEPDILQFEAVAGRTAYLVVTGRNYPDILANYTAATGRQPIPPRWAFGNFASRFGYRSEAQVRDVVRRYRELGIPLDGVILDIFWFGKDIKGHMGNLSWDRAAFPDPEGMIADFAADGVRTIVVTEPFILSTSSRWEEAVASGVLARNLAGGPRRFDFYFGNTGLIDVFDPGARDWFWAIYRGLIEQGVAGVWGDLGEPEVHPADTIHALGTADEVHNAFGHQWADLVFSNHEREYPDRRPVILMRSGFAGSQRYGMIPWTGDVARSWGGLQSQVELSLQMGLMGLAYIHSDLGGFADGETFDEELYLRWLQYGVFQPVFRPHAQEHIPSEPVFHGERVQTLAREMIRLRYRLLPYLYTLAWENATTGMPLARPLFFADETDAGLIDDRSAYLWGDAFLVAPVVRPDVTEKKVQLPPGVWLDFWSGRRIEGGREISYPLDPDTIPVLVRAGAFVPMTGDIATTRDYDSTQLAFHYYADESVTRARGTMYEDDGHTHRAHQRGRFELLEFKAQQQGEALDVLFAREAGGYAGMPGERSISLVIHNWTAGVNRVIVGGRAIELDGRSTGTGEEVSHDPQRQQLTIRFRWRGDPLTVEVN